MSFSINNSKVLLQFENLVSDFIKEKLELIMREEIENFLRVERPDLHDSKNGYYQKSLDTRFGKIEQLSVPRDRKGEFQTQVFESYQRRDISILRKSLHGNRSSCITNVLRLSFLHPQCYLYNKMD